MGQSLRHRGCPGTLPWPQGVCPGNVYGGYLTHCRHFKDTVSWAIPAEMEPTHSSQALCVRVVVPQSSAKAPAGVACGVFSGWMPLPFPRHHSASRAEERATALLPERIHAAPPRQPLSHTQTQSQGKV